MLFVYVFIFKFYWYEKLNSFMFINLSFLTKNTYLIFVLLQYINLTTTYLQIKKENMGNIYDEGNLKLSDKEKFDKISNLISKENYCSVCIVSFINYN